MYRDASSELTDQEQLEALAHWFDFAAAFLAREVAVSRSDAAIAHSPSDERPDEAVRFRSDELDELLAGFRRAADHFMASIARRKGEQQSAHCKGPHLQLVGGTDTAAAKQHDPNAGFAK